MWRNWAKNACIVWASKSISMRLTSTMGIKKRKDFMDYTPRELMVVCAARQIREGEHVFVGMRLPLIAFALAKRTHAPNCIGLFEGGIVRDEPSAELLYTMGAAPNITGASRATKTLNA